MDYEELFPDISPMDEILESDFTSNVCSSNWSQSHSLGDLVSDDMENLFLQTRLNLDGFDSASTISSEPSSPQNFKDCGEFLTDDDLVKLSIRDLNRRLKTLPKPEAYKIRKRRRSLKNRGYATSCRQRRTALLKGKPRNTKPTFESTATRGERKPLHGSQRQGNAQEEI